MNTLEYSKMELALARLNRDYSKICVSYAHHTRILEQHDAQLKLIQTNIENRKVMKETALKTMTELKQKIDNMEAVKANIPVPPTPKDIANKFMKTYTRPNPEAVEITYTKLYKKYLCVLSRIISDPTCKMKEADFKTFLEEYLNMPIVKFVKGISVFIDEEDAENWDNQE